MEEEEEDRKRKDALRESERLGAKSSVDVTGFVFRVFFLFRHFLVAIIPSSTAAMEGVHGLAKEGSLKALERAIKAEPSLIASKDNDGMTPFVSVDGNQHTQRKTNRQKAKRKRGERKGMVGNEQGRREERRERGMLACDVFVHGTTCSSSLSLSLGQC
jgi:hypothetical protein